MSAMAWIKGQDKGRVGAMMENSLALVALPGIAHRQWDKFIASINESENIDNIILTMKKRIVVKPQADVTRWNNDSEPHAMGISHEDGINAST